MARLFISFLGAGNYRPCNYVWSGGQCNTRFIQEATLRMIEAESWEASDRVCTFLTDTAENKNWLSHPEEETPTQGLKEVIDGMRLTAKMEAIHVPAGNNNEELWEIFQTVFDQIGEGDEVYFDITHGFRYLPMFSMVLMNYAKALKNISVKSISYGNFEGKTDNNAPITDLKPLSDLQDWTIAASDYKKYGNADALEKLARQTLDPLLKAPATRTTAVQHVNRFIKLLKEYSLERQTCRGLLIANGGTSQKLNEAFEKIEDTGITPLNPIFKWLQDTIKPAESTIRNCINAAKWCYERQLYQQAITILQEGMVSFIAERNGIGIADEAGRGLVAGSINFKHYDTPEEKWKGDAETIRKLLSDGWVDNLTFRNIFNATSDIRNDFNHAGFRSKRQPLAARKISKGIGERISDTVDLLSAEESAAPAPHPVFVNLSNHPVADWLEDQKAAATAYGELMDEPFPQIPADATCDEVEEIAQGVVRKLLAEHPVRALTVHVMGEMVASYHIVQLLKAAGVRCVASATRRDVQELGDGKKLSSFQFAGFREY